MSIYIKGIEIPKSCDECFFYTENCGGICRISNGNGCPLVSVPPHGRLIDADALEVAIQNEEESFADSVYEFGIADGMALIHTVVGDAPTIIEAEEEHNG